MSGAKVCQRRISVNLVDLVKSFHFSVTDVRFHPCHYSLCSFSTDIYGLILSLSLSHVTPFPFRNNLNDFSEEVQKIDTTIIYYLLNIHMNATYFLFR